MRDLILIRKTGRAEWTVKFPPFGFGTGHQVVVGSHRDGIREVDRRLVGRAHGSVVTDTERAGRWEDGISAPPGWSPTEPLGPTLPDY